MADPIQEVKDLCAKLSPQYQHILLRYAQVALTAENAAREIVPCANVHNAKAPEKTL